MFCVCEGFEVFVVCFESEIGCLLRMLVFVVGIYSGKDKFGEGVGLSFNVVRKLVVMNVFKVWYVYSLGYKVCVLSDMMEEGVKLWILLYIDIGEII